MDEETEIQAYRAKIALDKYVEFKSANDLLLFVGNFGTFEYFKQVCAEIGQPKRAKEYGNFMNSKNYRRLQSLLKTTYTTDGVLLIDLLKGKSK